MNRTKHLLLVLFIRGIFGQLSGKVWVFSMIRDSKEGKVIAVCVTWIAQGFSPGRPWFLNS